MALISGIAGGVDSAHKSGIFHRDLKPENILLPESGTGPKVVDFGVAKFTTTPGGEDGPATTSSGTIVGTPAYMAPEQLRGHVVDGRADVFSLGVMTYEMLTGKLPYGSGSFVDIAMKQAAGESKVDIKNLPLGLGRSSAARSPTSATRGPHRRQTSPRSSRDSESSEEQNRLDFIVYSFFFGSIAARRRSISATAWPI